MRIVWSWLREFCPTGHAASELAERLTLHGVKVEEVLRPWQDVKGVVVARVVKVEDHPSSQKLTVVTIDDGAGEHVVCAGIRNYEAGDLVPWAPPGSRVPALPEIRGRDDGIATRGRAVPFPSASAGSAGAGSGGRARDSPDANLRGGSPVGQAAFAARSR